MDIPLTKTISGPKKRRIIRLPMGNEGLIAPVKTVNPIKIWYPPVTKKIHLLFLPICSLSFKPILECPRNIFRKWWIYITNQNRGSVKFKVYQLCIYDKIIYRMTTRLGVRVVTPAADHKSPK